MKINFDIDPERFYREGYTVLNLKDSSYKSKLLEDLKTVNDKKFQHKNFMWRSKYSSTEDFRESIFEYSNNFVDVLFDNNIPEKIYKCINYRSVTLSHIQLRRSYPGNSYMDWHRDSYITDNKTIGMFPPCVKLIYYPLYSQTIECLKVIPGSHMRFFEHSKTDKNINDKFPKITLSSSDDNIILFDTSIWHSAINGNNPAGSLRLIYSFSNPEQHIKHFASKSIHENINTYYEKHKG